MKNLFAKSFWLRSVFYTMTNRLLLIVFGFVGYMLLAKKIFPSAREMGVWSLFLSIMSLTETIKQGLIRNPMIKFLSDPEYTTQRNKVQTSSLISNMIFTLVVILFISFFGRSFSLTINSPQLYPLISLGIVLLLLLVPFNHFETLLQAHFKFKQIFLGYVLRQGIFVGSIIFLFLFYKSSITLILLVRVQIISLTMGTCALLWGARSYLKKGLDIDRILMIKMFHFGKYVFGTNVFSALSMSSDQFITAKYITDTAVVAYYNVVSRIITMIDVPSMAVADVLFPKNVEAVTLSGNEKVRYYFERTVGTIISILLPVSLFIFIFPEFVIRIISSPKYLPAVPILQTIILFSFVRPLAFQFGATMDAIGKPQYNCWFNLYSMVITFLFIAAGLKYFGYMGAIYGEVAVIPFVYVVIYIILKKTIKVSLRSVLKYVWLSYTQVAGVVIKYFQHR